MVRDYRVEFLNNHFRADFIWLIIFCAGQNIRRHSKLDRGKSMKIKLVSVESSLDNIGFRKVSAYIKKIHDDTDIFFVQPGFDRTPLHYLLMKGLSSLKPADIEAVAKDIACDADIIGISSMTEYSELTANLIAAARRFNPSAYIVWGGIHPIIQPEDAIKHADAVCTGEGEFAFEAFLSAFLERRTFTATPGFWFNTPEGIVKNKNLPLMTGDDMDKLPILTYQSGEKIYKPGKGFVPIDYKDYVRASGLAYSTIWSIGCPFECTYCANSKFIDLDSAYRKLRHSSPATIVAEIKEAIRKHPHISSINFYDDSFMALSVKVLQEFSLLYKKEIGLPFAVIGVTPNYVRDEKLSLLIAAGMNRVRMGIQSGSQQILDFYDRPTPVGRILKSAHMINKYSQFMIPPSYDIILDNPLETQEDTLETLDLFYQIPKPYTLNIFALRIIPNTLMEAAFKERGVLVQDIRTTYRHHIPTISNILIYLIATFKLPRWLYLRIRNKAIPSHLPQKHYPVFTLLVRLLFAIRRGFSHLRFMDFSTLVPGMIAYYLWRIGVVSFWHKHLCPVPPPGPINYTTSKQYPSVRIVAK